MAYGSCCGTQLQDMLGDLFWHVLQQAYDHKPTDQVQL